MSKRFQTNLTLVLGVVGVLVWSAVFVRLPKAVAADDPTPPPSPTQIFCCTTGECPGEGQFGHALRIPEYEENACVIPPAYQNSTCTATSCF
jgi:hypothetical protein